MPIVSECYQTWWQLQCEIEDYYSERERPRPPLSRQKEFRSIKNAIIWEAEDIGLGTVTFEDEGAETMDEVSDTAVPPRKFSFRFAPVSIMKKGGSRA